MNHVFDIGYAREHANDELSGTDLFPGAYPGFGLFASMEHLESVFPEIITWSLDRQLEYADAICQKFCLNQSFIEKMVTGMKKSYNATSVGNLALLHSVNPNNEDLSREYTNFINIIKKQTSWWGYFKENFGFAFSLGGLLLVASYLTR